MPHTLITFLGRGGLGQDGYRTARYRFPSGAVRETPYFGLALLEELAAAGHGVDRVVVLGTTGSIWGALLGGRMTDESLWLDLSVAGEKEEVTQALLDRVRGDVVDRFRDEGLARDVALRLIPPGRDEAEQVAILKALAAGVGHADDVSLDVSHGFRHLPMVGLASALLLQALKAARIQGVYYGAFEMTDKAKKDDPTPVVRLDGLLRVARWGGAFDAFRHSGDYGVFSPLLAAEGLSAEHTGRLADSAFFERILRVDKARKKLALARKAILAAAGESAVLDLFADDLLDRTAWADRESHFERQLAAARAATAHGNYIQGAALGLESLITHAMPAGADPNNHKKREETKKKLNKRSEGIGRRNKDPDAAIFYQLNTLRNSLAHGTNPTNNRFGVHKALASEAALKNRLTELLDAVESRYGGA